MNYMNVFFTAQKQNVVLDVCALDQHLSLLQQGCDITNGLYLKVPQISALLQFLLVSLLFVFFILLLNCSKVGVSAWTTHKGETGSPSSC